VGARSQYAPSANAWNRTVFMTLRETATMGPREEEAPVAMERR